jgi:hypothetical protein
MIKWWDRLFRRKASMNEWIDNQLANGRSMSDLVFVETQTPVEWLRGDEEREGTWAVRSGFDFSDPEDGKDAFLLAVELSILDKVLFAKGAGRGGRGEVGKIFGDIEHDGRHYWLIDFEFDGYEYFSQDGTIKPGGD